MRAAALARGHALLAFIQNVSRPAAADARRHAFAAPATVRANRFASALDLVVAQFAHAHFRGEAIGVLLAPIRTDGHANAVLGTPSRRAAANVRARATAAETTAFALRLAQCARHVALVSVTTVQDSDPFVVILTKRISLIIAVEIIEMAYIRSFLLTHAILSSKIFIKKKSIISQIICDSEKRLLTGW